MNDRPADPRETSRRARAIAEVPFLRFLGTSLVEEGYLLSLSLPWSADALNAADALHGGVISTALDVAAYLAVLPELADDEEAVTHAFAASYLAAASPGDPLHARGSVLRRSRRLAFLQSELRADGNLLALASVTKSIVPRSAT